MEWNTQFLATFVPNEVKLGRPLFKTMELMC